MKPDILETNRKIGSLSTGTELQPNGDLRIKNIITTEIQNSLDGPTVRIETGEDGGRTVK